MRPYTKASPAPLSLLDTNLRFAFGFLVQVSTRPGKSHADAHGRTIPLGKNVMEGQSRNEDEITRLGPNRLVRPSTIQAISPSSTTHHSS